MTFWKKQNYTNREQDSGCPGLDVGEKMWQRGDMWVLGVTERFCIRSDGYKNLKLIFFLNIFIGV